MRSFFTRRPLLLAADIYRMLREPKKQRGLIADARATRAEMVSWRELREPPPGAPVVLFLSLTNWPYQIKTEAMIALALKRRGWRPVLLTSWKLGSVPERYWRAFGLRDVVHLEMETQGADTEAVHEAAATLLAGEPSFPAIKQWSYEQSWIGPQVLATASRRLREGLPDPRIPAVREAIATALPEILGNVIKGRQVMKRLRPDLVVANEVNYVFGPLVDAALARDIPVIQFVQPWRDDALTFKRITRATRRTHPSAVERTTLDRLIAEPPPAGWEERVDRLFADRYGGRWVLQARNQPGVQRRSRAELEQVLALDPARPTAVVFSHVLWDANLFYGEDLFDDYGHWFIETVRAAAANPRANWVIKLHPANLWKRTSEGVTGEYNEIRLIREHVGELPSHVRLLLPETDVSTLDLFELADVAVTVRGTAGMEFPCFGRPAVTAGTGRYSGLGFTIDPASRQEYLDVLSRIETVTPLDEATVYRARLHAFAAFDLRLWKMLSFSIRFRDDAPAWLRPDLALSDAAFGDDLDRLADWVLSGEVDYIDPPAPGG